MSVDLTGVAVAATGGFFSILAAIVTLWLTNHMSNKQAAVVVSNAVNNSLGALQTAATSEIQALHPTIPGVPASLAPGVQYVLNNAGAEADQLGITPAAIAAKIEARIGLQNIATNLAVAANDTPVTPPPLAVVPAR